MLEWIQTEDTEPTGGKLAGRCLERVAVLFGGSSAERSISIQSGRAVAQALQGPFAVESYLLDEDALPTGLDPATTLVFPVLHGFYGEDGTLQQELELAGFDYVGSDPHSSRLCMDKLATKARVGHYGLRSPLSMSFPRTTIPSLQQLRGYFGGPMVVKPRYGGSSIGFSLLDTEEQWEALHHNEAVSDWLVEERIAGTEITVGILHEDALEVVEIVPGDGYYSFDSKYQQGGSEYHVPARLPASALNHLKRGAELAAEACGVRDFCRVDFMVSSDRVPFFLEINTIPGMTETSLLPKSAQGRGLSFEALVAGMLQPAIDRFAAREETE